MKNLSLDPIHHINTVQIQISYLFKTQFNIILPIITKLRLSSTFLSSLALRNGSKIKIKKCA
jgi:hypothetical protein